LIVVALLHLDLVFNVPETNFYYDLSRPAGWWNGGRAIICLRADYQGLIKKDAML
jgi:hypothetical protein